MQLFTKVKEGILHSKSRFQLGKEELLDLIYPKRCFGCKKPLKSSCNIYLCSDCWYGLDHISPPFCTVCGRPMDILDEDGKATVDRCPDCTGYSYHFKRGYAATLYQGLVKECIHSFKYNSQTYLSGTLAKLMIDFSLRYMDFGKINSIVPVPLHWRRLRERGFNQAELLARHISKGLGISLTNRGLQRIRHIPAQIDLPRNQRLSNVRGAFKVTGPESFRGKRILLIDDVFTTGATMDECSRVILEAGAKEVWVFSLARGV